PEDLDLLRTAVDPDRLEWVWVGEGAAPEIGVSLQLTPQEAEVDGVDRLKRHLQEKGVVFRPW
ncbi:MAG: hypothetical protein KJZ47_10810, partial [Gemmatimonadales bacterium]|nr:hypothetical protein [Gemmatimonadales bacterium]